MKKEPEQNFAKLIICFLLRQLSSLCLKDNKKIKILEVLLTNITQDLMLKIQ